MKLSVTVDQSVAPDVMPLLDTIKGVHQDWTIRVFGASNGLKSPFSLPFLELKDDAIDVRRYGEDALLALKAYATPDK